MKYSKEEKEVLFRALTYLQKKYEIEESIVDEIYEELFVNIPIQVKDYQEYQDKKISIIDKLKITLDYKYTIRDIKDEKLKSIKLNRLSRDYNLSIESINKIIYEWEYVHGGN